MYFRTDNPSLSHSVFMTYCFSCSCSCFSSFSGFISYQVSCLFHMAFQILVRYDAYPHIIHVFLFLDESTLLRNWNHSNRIIQTQVMAFSCQLVGLPIFPKEQLEIFIFQCFDSIFDTGSLYSFKVKVLRVLFQLESPNSEHRNSSYVRNYSDYSMIKRMQELACTWPHFE